MDPNQVAPAGTPAAPIVAPPAAPVVGTATGESFMPAAAPAAPAAPAAAAPAAPPAKGGGGRVALTNDELRDRLTRAKAAALRDVFGTDDANAIRERLAKADALEKAAEEAKLARMSEQQRMQHDLTKARAERDRYRGELSMAHEREIVREQSSFVERIAGKHVNPAALEEASLAFARKVATTDPKVVAKWTERDVDRWFKSYVESKPFMGQQAASAATPARRVERSPGGATRPPPRPTAPATSATNGSKTFRPGQSNSMTRQEAREEMKRRGFSY